MNQKMCHVYALAEELFNSSHQIDTQRVTDALNALALDAGHRLENLKFSKNDIQNYKTQDKYEYMELFCRHFD